MPNLFPSPFWNIQLWRTHLPGTLTPNFSGSQKQMPCSPACGCLLWRLYPSLSCQWTSRDILPEGPCLPASSLCGGTQNSPLSSKSNIAIIKSVTESSTRDAPTTASYMEPLLLSVAAQFPCASSLTAKAPASPWRISSSRGGRLSICIAAVGAVQEEPVTAMHARLVFPSYFFSVAVDHTRATKITVSQSPCTSIS